MGSFTYQRRRAKGARSRVWASLIGATCQESLTGLPTATTRPAHCRETYQLVRNVLAVSVDHSGVLSSGKGHAVLIYDERNPVFVSGGAGSAAYAKTRGAVTREEHFTGEVFLAEYSSTLSGGQSADHGWQTNSLQNTACNLPFAVLTTQPAERASDCTQLLVEPEAKGDC